VQTVANCELPVLTYLLYPTVRSGSGKISESTEMFGCAEGLLFPLKPAGAGAASSAVTSSVAGAVKEGALADAAMTPPALPSRDSASTASGQPAAPASAAAGGTMGVAANTRLITFDSTDPEFDEDSDPDADLDL
jgi:hypothetical protein